MANYHFYYKVIGNHVGGYGLSQMESHGAVGLSVCLSVGWSVGRSVSQSVVISRKAVSNKRRKECILVSL